MMYPVGGVPPDGGVQETVMVLLPVNIALRPVGGLGAAVAYMRDNDYHDTCVGTTRGGGLWELAPPSLLQWFSYIEPIIIIVCLRLGIPACSLIFMNHFLCFFSPCSKTLQRRGKQDI